MASVWQIQPTELAHGAEDETWPRPPAPAGAAHAARFRHGRRRALVLEAVREAESLVTADEVARRVWARDPTVARSTVYRALDALRRSGEVLTVRLDGAAARYEIADCAHPHAVCRVCGEVTHLPSEAIGTVVDEVSWGNRFVAMRAEIVVIGVCIACAGRTVSRRLRRSRP